jgi:hypothetical protein
MHPARAWKSAAAVALAACLAGCGVGPEQYHQVLDQRDQAKRQAAELTEANARLRQESAEKDEQIATLQALGPQRIEKLFRVEGIRLGRFTAGVDLDGDGSDDGVKVYLQPTDAQGSTVKAAGDVMVQLYDLAESSCKSLVGEYYWGVDQIGECWAGGFLSDHYSLVCPWQSDPPAHDEITVRVEFVDYLTGKTFTAQKLIQIAPISK